MSRTNIEAAVPESINLYRASSPLLGLLAGALMISASMSLQAQTNNELEEIVVSGIRDSLRNAASIKRNEAGVVDAITAEDIADFPDANLAESLQRVTGVSIDRQDNEGNQISVRGLGPSFNLVTLNGRQMPVASSPDVETLNSATQSRAFNFAEIASESVSSVNVFKTGRADLPSGGIGATLIFAPPAHLTLKKRNWFIALLVSQICQTKTAVPLLQRLVAFFPINSVITLVFC